MDSSKDNLCSTGPAHGNDVDNPSPLVPQVAPDRELSLALDGVEENKTKNNQPNDNVSHDNSDTHRNRTDDRSALVPYSAPHREFSSDVIMSEEIQDDENGDDSESESDSDKDSLSGNEILYDDDGPYADYIRGGVAELRDWKRGKFYIPERCEPQRVLISSPQKLQESLNACNNIVHELAEQLRSLPEHDHVLRVIRDAAYPSTNKTVRIGLQGAAASGKSSLINALLNFPGLALADCGMDACTRFPIEYAAPQPGQIEPIAVQIRFFDEATRSELLKEQLVKYREGIAQLEDEGVEELEDARQRHQEALDFFTAVFSNRSSFRNQATTHEFLTQSSMDTTCTTMQQWLCELLRTKNVTSNNVSFGADTAADLNELFEPYIGSLDDLDNPNNQAVLWPIIKSMNVHVASTILDSGVVLVDAPGLSDLNGYRVAVAHTSLETCDHIVVVLNGQGRAQDDLDAQKTIEKVARKNGSNMTVVVTHNDGTWNSATKATTFRRDKILADIDRSKSALEAEITSIERTSRKQRIKLRAKLRNLKLRVELLDWVGKGRKIELTTATTQAKLQKLYADKHSNGSLNIHNVSNTWYTDLTSTYSSSAGMRPPIRSTGIPQLRESIRKIGEKPQVDRLDKHIRHFLPNALTNILLWCDPTRVDISRIARPAIQDSMEDCRTILRNFSSDLSKMAQQHIVRTINEGMEKWERESREALEPYIGSTVNVQTVNAFINKHGVHTPCGKQSTNINELLMKPMLQKLLDAFHGFKNDAYQSVEKVKEGLLQNCDGLFRRMENSEANLILAQKKGLLQTKRLAVQGAISTVFQDSTRALTVHLRGFKSFAVDTNYDYCIMRVLHPEYDRIKMDFPRSRGYCRARQIKFYNYIHLGQLYDDYLYNIEDYNRLILGKFYDESVKAKIDTIFVDMHQALIDFCVTPVMDRQELRQRAVVGEMIKAKLSLLEGEISQKFRESLSDADTTQTGQKRKRSD